MTIINSTVNGNRADDRGGAISGEADVSVIGSTIARNAAVAHVGGGVWARNDLYVTNSTIASNSAEGAGRRRARRGRARPRPLDRARQRGPGRGSLAAGDGLTSFGSIIGPTNTGRRRPGSTDRDQLSRYGCRVARLQLHLRRLLRARRAGRFLEGATRCSEAWPHNGGLGETRLPGPAARSWTPSRPEPAVSPRSATASKASSTWRLSTSIHGSRHHRPARVPAGPGSGCDIGAVELGSAPVAPPGPPSDVGPPPPRAAATVRAIDHEPRRRPLDTCRGVGDERSSRTGRPGAKRPELGDLEERVDLNARRIRIMERSRSASAISTAASRGCG